VHIASAMTTLSVPTGLLQTGSELSHKMKIPMRWFTSVLPLLCTHTWDQSCDCDLKDNSRRKTSGEAVWWLTPVILALRKLRQEDHQLLGCTVRTCPKKPRAGDVAQW
jgi:hypothetical protein